MLCATDWCRRIMRDNPGIISLFPRKNSCCWYSFGASRRGGSNGYYCFWFYSERRKIIDEIWSEFSPDQVLGKLIDFPAVSPSLCQMPCVCYSRREIDSINTTYVYILIVLCWKQVLLGVHVPMTYNKHAGMVVIILGEYNGLRGIVLMIMA